MSAFYSEGAAEARRQANASKATLTRHLLHFDPTRCVKPLESAGAREARRLANESLATVTRHLINKRR